MHIQWYSITCTFEFMYYELENRSTTYNHSPNAKQNMVCTCLVLSGDIQVLRHLNPTYTCFRIPIQIRLSIGVTSLIGLTKPQINAFLRNARCFVYPYTTHSFCPDIHVQVEEPLKNSGISLYHFNSMSHNFKASFTVFKSMLCFKVSDP